MKVGRIIGILLLALLVLYLLLFHAANPVLLSLPGLGALLPPLPASYLVVLALIVGFLSGWLPSRLSAWRSARQVRLLEKRVAQLEQQAPPATLSKDPFHTSDFPVIPDRSAHQQSSDAEPYSDHEAG